MQLIRRLNSKISQNRNAVYSILSFSFLLILSIFVDIVTFQLFTEIVQKINQLIKCNIVENVESGSIMAKIIDLRRLTNNGRKRGIENDRNWVAASQENERSSRHKYKKKIYS